LHRQQFNPAGSGASGPRHLPRRGRGIVGVWRRAQGDSAFSSATIRGRCASR